MNFTADQTDFSLIKEKIKVFFTLDVSDQLLVSVISKTVDGNVQFKKILL